MRTSAKIYIGAVILGGLACFLHAMVQWTCGNPVQYICYLCVALVASGLKIALPNITGTLSVSYVFVLLSMLDFSYSETMLLACLAVTAQYAWRHKNPLRLLYVVFNLGSMGVAVAVGYSTFQLLAGRGQRPLITVAFAATGYFLANSLSVATVVALTESKKLHQVWRDAYFWTFPYYLVGGLVAAGISFCNRNLGWESVVLGLPVVYAIFHSYRQYLRRLESEKLHAEQIAALHLRTIEALAMAIEAKDDTTHSHLQRVQVYAVELGKKLGLTEAELEALHAASLLHDIGKLAVPEHIISKPGKLTPEEFEKMKIHPTVGAEILDRVQFPYDVVPIVRAHHEKWDGSGYPHGLKGKEIPLGARILSAVDCLDALASDRQYRRALPLDEAMKVVISEAGRSYDPAIVKVLAENYSAWERLAGDSVPSLQPLSRDVAVTNGGAPATGFQSQSASQGRQPEFLSSIAAARQEAQTLYELTQDLGNSLSLHETLCVLDSRLKRLIPYDAIAVYLCEENRLIPKYVNGDNFRLFSSLAIPIGQGLSGWVAETGQPIINGNPSVEPGYLDDPTKFSCLRSALAVPLTSAVGVIGVLSLYHLELDAFSPDHLRVLLALNSKVSLTIENAVKYAQVSISATIDSLTGLPNAGALFLHLDAQLARSKRTHESLAVLVCDLDGFKQVNDRFGHLEGNRILKLVANGLREGCREYDCVARMGGDEFVLVLPGLKPEDLPSKTAYLEKVAVEAGLAVCGERLLNISVGATFCPEHSNDAEGLLAEADRKMYLVKQSRKRSRGDFGRDLATLATSLSDSLPVG